MFLNGLEEEKIGIRRYSCCEMQVDITLLNKLLQKTRYNHLVLSEVFLAIVILEVLV